MRLRRYISLVGLVLSLGLLVCSAACTPGNPSRPESNGEGILGRSAVATTTNSRIRCDFVTLEENHYPVTCYTVVFDTIGEIRATSYAANLSPEWASLLQTAGPSAQVSCSSAIDRLSTTCDVRTPGPTPTTYMANLTLTDIETSAKTNLNAELTLPFTADTFGTVPYLPDLQPRSSVSSALPRRSLADAKEPELVGIQTRELPLENLPLSFGGGKLAGDLLVLSGNYGYHVESKTLRMVSSIAAPSQETQTATPIVALDTNRLRLKREGLTARAFTSKGDLALLRSEESGQSIVILPEAGASRVFLTVPKVSGEYVFGSSAALAEDADGNFVINSPTRVWRVRPTGATPIAGVGENPGSGHAETSAATSLVLGNSNATAYPDGSVLILDSSGADLRERAILVRPDGSYVVLWSYTELDASEHCFGNLSAGVSNAGAMHLLKKGCNTTFLYSFEGTARKSTVTSTQALDATTCAGFPAKGTKVPLANFPLHGAGVYVAGIHSNAGTLFVSPCGAAAYSAATAMVESLFTTRAKIPGGVLGENARTAIYGSVYSLNYVGTQLVGLSGANLITIDPEKNTVSSLPLTGGYNGFGNSLDHLIVSPGGARFVLTLALLYRIESDGALTQLMWTGGTMQAAFASDTLAYAIRGGSFGRIDIVGDTGTFTALTSVPASMVNIRSAPASLGPDGAFYAITKQALGRLPAPLDGSTAFQIMMGEGSAAPYSGGYAHEMKFAVLSTSPAAHFKRVQVIGTDVFFSDEYTANLLKCNGTQSNGAPLCTFQRLFPSASPNADCAANLTQRVSSETGEGLMPTLDAICPSFIYAVSARLENGVAQLAFSRQFGAFSNILIMGMPL